MKLDEFNAKYFDQGFVVTRLTEDLISQCWHSIYSTTWRDATRLYKQVPDWYIEGTDIDVCGTDVLQERELLVNKQMMDVVPQFIKDLAERIVEQDIFNFVKLYRSKLVLSHVHVWNGAEDAPYHQDVSDGSNILVLCYLTDSQEWKSEWGGTLTLKKHVNGCDKYITEVTPSNGVMVIINNDNPTVLHQVTPMYNNDINRYTLSFSYKWII